VADEGSPDHAREYAAKGRRRAMPGCGGGVNADGSGGVLRSAPPYLIYFILCRVPAAFFL
jgi:hypothetical protein